MWLSWGVLAQSAGSVGPIRQTKGSGPHLESQHSGRMEFKVALSYTARLRPASLNNKRQNKAKSSQVQWPTPARACHPSTQAVGVRSSKLFHFSCCRERKHSDNRT